MARQSTTPVAFNRTTRRDHAVTMTSARAGVVVPLGFIPFLPGDSGSGSVGLDIQLAEMPKPLLNAVTANFQAWFVPKQAMPQFSGKDEVMAAFTGESIRSLGPDGPNLRAAQDYFYRVPGEQRGSVMGSDLYKTLGLHVQSGTAPVNSDLIDAFVQIYNFRLAAHSSKLARRLYAAEDIEQACRLPPAFWPSSRFSSVVPDYERALVVGSLDLDVIAGRLPISGIGKIYPGDPSDDTNIQVRNSEGQVENYARAGVSWADGRTDATAYRASANGQYWDIFAEMAGQSVSVSLADIDNARKTKAFAKMQAAYAGNDASGFDNDDAIVAMLMQGLPVDPDQFQRPWLLDSRRVPVGFAERFATDAGNLDQSVTQGRASARLSINVPASEFGGVVIYTVEVLPERIDERMSDEWVHLIEPSDMPNALRDVQRIEPVDLVTNRRIDVRHTTPDGLYGYEPMNNKWNRDFTRLGGVFYNSTPGAGFNENRANIWQTEIVDPAFNSGHYLAPAPFPHDVFADQTADAFEAVARHAVSIVGLTQIGDVLAEDNNEYEAVETAGQEE